MTDHARRHRHVVNLAEITPRAAPAGEVLGCVVKWLGRAADGRGLGCSAYEVQPGHAATPLHYHCANEEAIFVLDGEGELRIGGETVALRAGDYAALPVGPDFTHQLKNTGQAVLRYLCMSTMLPTEIIGYPEERKVSAVAAQSLSGEIKPWVVATIPVEMGERSRGEGSG